MAEQRKQQDSSRQVDTARHRPAGRQSDEDRMARRRPEAIEADEALTEALEEAKAEKEPARETGNRGRRPEDSEAAGE